MRKQKSRRIPDRLYSFSIAILTLIAVVLGIAIFRQQNIALPSLLSKTPSPTPSSATSRISRNALPPNVTEEERFLYSPPRKEASPEAQKAFYGRVAQLAKEAPSLTLNKCEKPEPLVIKVKQGADVKIENDDIADHTIVINPEHKYKIESKKTAVIKVDFGRGVGQYGYTCEGVAGLVGWFSVEP